MVAGQRSKERAWRDVRAHAPRSLAHVECSFQRQHLQPHLPTFAWAAHGTVTIDCKMEPILLGVAARDRKVGA